MKYWIKLWTTILDDPKVGVLPDDLWRRMVELFLVAGEVDQDGLIPPADQIAWRLRMDQKTVLQDLGKLWDLGIVKPQGEVPDCPWLVVKFQERQKAKTSTERTRLARKKTAMQQQWDELSQNCPKTVPSPGTDRLTEQNRTEQNRTDHDDRTSADVLADLMSDPDDPLLDANLKALITNYQDHISISINPILADDMKVLARSIPDTTWIPDAFNIALANGIDRWPYIRKIIVNSAKSGRGPKKRERQIKKLWKGLKDVNPTSQEFRDQLENL